MSDIKKARKLFSYRDNQALDKELSHLYDWVSRLEVVETNPDGSRKGRYAGEAVLLISGGNYYVEICVGAGTTTWLGVLLSNAP